MKNVLLSILVVLMAAAGTVLVIQQQSQAKLHGENESLRQQLDQLAQLQADNEHLSNRLAQATAAAGTQTTELLKLRNEVGMLRKQSVEIAALQSKNQQLNAVLASNRTAQLAKTPAVAAPPTSTPAPSATVPEPADLGPIQLVNQMPSRFDLGPGKSCTLIPTIDVDGNYNIKVVFENLKPNGSVIVDNAQIITAPGHGVSLTSGDNTIAFTPTVNSAP